MSESLAEAIERLEFHLEHQSGFWFALIATDAEAPRARMREVTERFCQENGVSFFLYALDPLALVPLGIELSRGRNPGIHWIRADGVKGTAEEWEKQATLLFMAMNERRDAYRKRLEGAIIVEGRSSLKRRLRDLAPDLFSIRAFLAEPGEEGGGVAFFEAAEGRAEGLSFRDEDKYRPDPERLLKQIGLFQGRDDAASLVHCATLRIEAIMALLGAGRPRDAVAVAEALRASMTSGLPLEIQPWAEYAVHQANLAVARETGDPKRALMHADKLVELQERYSLYARSTRSVRYADRGRIRFAAGDLTGAIEDFRRALLLDAMDLRDDPTSPELQRMFVEHTVAFSDIVWRLPTVSAELFDECMGILRSALAYVEARLTEKPDEMRWLYQRCRIEQQLSFVLLRRGDMESASQWIKRATASEWQCLSKAPIDDDVRQMVKIGHALRTIYVEARRS